MLRPTSTRAERRHVQPFLTPVGVRDNQRAQVKFKGSSTRPGRRGAAVPIMPDVRLMAGSVSCRHCRVNRAFPQPHFPLLSQRLCRLRRSEHGLTASFWPTWTDTKRDPQHHSIPGAITDEISFPASIVIRHFPGPGHTPFPESPSAAFIHYRESCPDTHSLSPPPSALLLTRTKHTTRSLCLLHGPLHSVYSLTAMVLEA